MINHPVLHLSTYKGIDIIIYQGELPNTIDLVCEKDDKSVRYLHNAEYTVQQALDRIEFAIDVKGL
jgi:hypothetical protein